MMFVCLLLAFVVCVGSEAVNINIATDVQLKYINDRIRSSKDSVTKIPAGTIGAISYSEGILVGLDSMNRTGDCIVELQPTSASFDIHFGFTLLAAVFGSVTIKDQEMSAFYRIRDNSLHLAFTIHNDTECKVTLDDIAYERVSDIEIATSRSEFSSPDLNEFFRNRIVLEMNRILKTYTTAIEILLQGFCLLLSNNHLAEFNKWQEV